MTRYTRITISPDEGKTISAYDLAVIIDDYHLGDCTDIFATWYTSCGEMFAPITSVTSKFGSITASRDADADDDSGITFAALKEFLDSHTEDVALTMEVEGYDATPIVGIRIHIPHRGNTVLYFDAP